MGLSVLSIPSASAANNYYYQQQQQQRMLQQQQEQSRRQQEQNRIRQEETRRQQERMRQQQQRQQAIMRDRQQKMLQQRQQSQQKQRKIQQERLRKAQKQQSQGKRQQLAKQQKTIKKEQALRQQRAVKIRKEKLAKLQKERRKKALTEKKKGEQSQILTMVSLSSLQKTRLPATNSQPKTYNNLTAKQFKQFRAQQQKQQRTTKQLETKRNLVKANLTKMADTRKRISNKKQVVKKQQIKKQSEAKKLANKNFKACDGKGCGTLKCSFHGDTLVKTLDGFEPIKSLVVGEDIVWSRNEFTGEMAWKNITAHYSNPYEETVSINIQDKASGLVQTISSNRIHPFYISNALNEAAQKNSILAGTNEHGKWIEAQNLKPKDKLLDNYGNLSSEVISIDIKPIALKAYNLTVNDFHTYFVKGAANDNITPVWVHNDCDENKATKKSPRYDGQKPTYHINPAHVPGQRGFNSKKTPIPNDAEKVFKSAVPNDPKNPTAWFGKNTKGQVYRFSSSNDGTAHFSGIDGVGSGVRNLTPYAKDRLNGL